MTNNTESSTAVATTTGANPRFLHYRYIDGDGNILSRGGITYAYQQAEPGLYKIAVAKCHTRDNFSKHLGRVKAAGRLSSPSRAQIFEGDESALLDMIEHANNAASHLYNIGEGITIARKFSGRKKLQTSA
jgi:hypothetical protein